AVRRGSWGRSGSHVATLSLGLAEDPRHERLQALADELLDLDGQNLGGVHLAVEELHHAAKFRGDHICHEDHPDPPGLEVGLDLLPEALRVAARPQERLDLLPRVSPSLSAALLEPGTDGLDLPGHGRVSVPLAISLSRCRST